MDSYELKYFNIDWASEYDGPGIRTVVYLQGCHLDCPWCHTPNSKLFDPPVLFFNRLCINCGKCVEICSAHCHFFYNDKHKYTGKKCRKCLKCIEVCPNSDIGESTGALVYTLKTSTAGKLFEKLSPQLKLLRKSGGLTISGGEPLCQHRALNRLLYLCRENGINTALETSGNIDVPVIRRIYRNVDHWLIGLHPWTKNGYRFDNKIYLFFDFLIEKNADIIIRMPIIPRYTDAGEVIKMQCEFLRHYNIREIEIMWYNEYTSLYNDALGTEENENLKNIGKLDFANVERTFIEYGVEIKNNHKNYIV